MSIRKNTIYIFLPNINPPKTSANFWDILYHNWHIISQLNKHKVPNTRIRVWDSNLYSILRFELSCIHKVLFRTKLSHSYRSGILHIHYHNEVIKSRNISRYECQELQLNANNINTTFVFLYEKEFGIIERRNPHF